MDDLIRPAQGAPPTCPPSPPPKPPKPPNQQAAKLALLCTRTTSTYVSRRPSTTRLTDEGISTAQAACTTIGGGGVMSGLIGNPYRKSGVSAHLLKWNSPEAARRCPPLGAAAASCAVEAAGDSVYDVTARKRPHYTDGWSAVQGTCGLRRRAHIVSNLLQKRRRP